MSWVDLRVSAAEIVLALSVLSVALLLSVMSDRFAHLLPCELHPICLTWKDFSSQAVLAGNHHGHGDRA